MEFKESNERGFLIGKFLDRNHIPCYLKELCIIDEEGCILFGVDSNDPKSKPKYFDAKQGWIPLPLSKDIMESNILYNSSMRLSQSMVKELLPALTFFVENGYLPSEGDIPETNKS
jgi:hypothetical protein